MTDTHSDRRALTDQLEIRHPAPATEPDSLAYRLVKLFWSFTETDFKKRYGHRAASLETVAAVPGMVGGTLVHLRCLRRFEDDRASAGRTYSPDYFIRL